MTGSSRLVVVLLADTEGHENMGRALHALLYARQAHDEGMDVELIFDGGGVEWAQRMPTDEHFKELYEDLVDRGVISAVCEFCAGAFDVKEELEAGHAPLHGEDNGHPNIGKRAAAGARIVTL